ncbi:serine protease [Listeria costaricensis]|uniref:serine protease n=1 Tax=Listeria costaricensis TaxID=2026604 RepID=UPI000C086977|nr:serine protease [Listeria costaricensis]
MDILMIIIKAIGSLLMQPTFYIAMILVVAAGFNRVKWERKSFSVRIYSPWMELKNFFRLSFWIAITISIATFFAGFSVTIEWLIIFNIVTILLLLVSMFRLSSTAFTIGISSLIFYICYYYDIDLTPFTDANFPYGDLYIDNFMIAMTFVLAALLLVEGYLIQNTSAKWPSPSLRRTKRGKLAGAFQLRKLWFVPLIAFIPGDDIQRLFDWWPVFTIGTSSYSLIILPLIVGFQQQVQGHLPTEISKKISMQVTTLAVIIGVTGVLSIMMPTLTLFAFVLAIIARIWISYRYYRADKLAPKAYLPQSDGLVVLGARENTASARLNLTAGEKIVEINGVKVNSRETMYEALNVNRAFCKMKVVDQAGEPRFEQTALYEDDSFELGLLFVEPRT